MKALFLALFLLPILSHASRTSLADVDVAILQEGTSYYYCPPASRPGFEYLSVMLMGDDARKMWFKMTAPQKKYTASIQEKMSKYMRCASYHNGERYTCEWTLKQKTYIPMLALDARAALFHICTGASLFMLPSENTTFDFNTNELTFLGGKITDYLVKRGEPACVNENGKFVCRFPAPKYID